MIEVRILSFVLQIDPVTLQVGVSEAEQVLCSGTVNLAQLLTVSLGLWTMYLILKGLLRIMGGLENKGKREHVGSDGIRSPNAVDAYSHRQARGGIYSWGAALLPVFIPTFLAVVGIDVVACLF